MLNQSNATNQARFIITAFCLAIMLAISLISPLAANEKALMTVAYAEENVAMAAEGIASEIITFLVEPIDASTDCTWELSIDESQMTTWLTNRVKEKNISDYIQLTIEGNKCTVTALQYFRYGIKYTTYYKLTATSTENTELSATCSIKLG